MSHWLSCSRRSTSSKNSSSESTRTPNCSALARLPFGVGLLGLTLEPICSAECRQAAMDTGRSVDVWMRVYWSQIDITDRTVAGLIALSRHHRQSKGRNTNPVVMLSVYEQSRVTQTQCVTCMQLSQKPGVSTVPLACSWVYVCVIPPS